MGVFMRIAYVIASGHGAVDQVLADVVARLEQAGVALAGTVQTNTQRVDRTRCDMDLRLLPDGPVIRISHDRGEGARGCRLDAEALEQSVLWTETALQRAELLVVNKFGKQESAGRGLAGTIALALDRGVPVLVGVNGLNIDAFLEFAGDLAEELPTDPDIVTDWCLGVRGGGHARPHQRGML